MTAKGTKEKEMTAVEPEVVEVMDNSNIMKLSKPLPDGKTEIVFDFDSLNGYKLLACMKQAKKKDPGMTVPALSMEYQANVAAAAAKLRYDDILNLSGPDFMAACLKAQNFLLPSDQ